MASPSSPNESSRKTEEIKKQVEEVKEILQTNVEMMKNRGEAVESMQGRTGDIELGAGQFRRTSQTVQRRHFWEALKFKIFIVLSVIFLIACGVAGFVFWDWRNKKPKHPTENFYELDPEDVERAPAGGDF